MAASIQYPSSNVREAITLSLGIFQELSRFNIVKNQPISSRIIERLRSVGVKTTTDNQNGIYFTDSKGKQYWVVAYTYSVDAITIQKTRGIFSVDVVEFFVRNSENEDYSHDTFAIVTGGNNEDISERAVKFIRGIV